MKFLALIGLIALTMSCKDQSVDGQYTITEGQSVEVSSAGKATLTASSIQNNLCPTGVQCIRAGEILGDFLARQDGNTVAVSLCNGPDCQNLHKGVPAKTTVAAGSRTWTIELVNVLTTTPAKAVVNVVVQ